MSEDLRIIKYFPYRKGMIKGNVTAFPRESMTKYNGKCYYTLEEYEALVAAGVLNTEDYGRRDGR